jgi:hypothetical protein
MKLDTLFIAGVLALSFNSAIAQKQSAGDHSLELQVAPLGSEPVKISGIRFRHFKDDNTALRLTAFLGGSRSKTITQEADGDLLELQSLSSDRNLTLRPGFEKHFDGNDKLSPYIGAEALLKVDWTKSSSEAQWLQESQIATNVSSTRNSTFGLNAVAGMDYYFGEQLFLGLEMGFGFSKEMRGISRTKYDNPETAMENTDSKGNATSFNWGPTYQGTFRLGWLFN